MIRVERENVAFYQFLGLRDFTAIDFETANRYPTSACSIGIVVVQDGEITEEFSHLIKPEPYYFNKKFIDIHGITPAMVKDAPSFYDLWGVIGRYFDTEALVAHNVGFDMSVLKACLKWADLYVRLPESFCTCRLSRKLVKGLPNYKLNTLCDHFGIALNHHEALSDARGAAKIMIELSKLSLFHDFFPHCQ